MTNPPNSLPDEIVSLWKQEPLYKHATEALDKLIEKGCDYYIIDGYLRRIVGYREGAIRALKVPKSAETAWRLRSIVGQLRRQANRIGELISIWGFWERMVDAKCIHTPEESRNIAKRLSQVCTKNFGCWHPHREAMLDLLEHVRESTGRYQYGEVSDVINAAYCWPALRQKHPLVTEMLSGDAHRMTGTSSVLAGARSGRKHSQVNHSAREYVRLEDGTAISTNSVESYFAILKRGKYGVYHHWGRLSALQRELIACNC